MAIKKKNPADEPQDLTPDDIPILSDELRRVLEEALDTSPLDGKTILNQIKTILDVKIKNEYTFSKLLRAGVENDFIKVQDGITLNRKVSKDSITELVKLQRLLEDLSTENVSISVEEKAELDRLRGDVFGRG